MTSVEPLDIVGYIINNQPGYAVYNTSYITANDIKADSTVQLVYGNYAFDAKIGSITLLASAGAKGYEPITTMDQAKAWFSTDNAKTDLLILKSFYYQ